MIRPVVGFIWKERGRRIAMVAGVPRPGRMPTIVPRKTPTKHQKRFTGVKATAKPSKIFCKVSIEVLSTGA